MEFLMQRFLTIRLITLHKIDIADLPVKFAFHFVPLSLQFFIKSTNKNSDNPSGYRNKIDGKNRRSFFHFVSFSLQFEVDEENNLQR